MGVRKPPECSLFLLPGTNAPKVLKSRLCESALHDDDYLDSWLSSARAQKSMSSLIVPLDDVKGWIVEQDTGNIVHANGKFFSVLGLHCRHRAERYEIQWDQPVIEQPEIGILGIIAKSINGVLHFCLQAKEEPGNISSVQLSPTVRATYSNYTRAHGGSCALFLDCFLSPSPDSILYSRLQTEDGGRFMFKSNRNMIIVCGEEVSTDLPDGFIWLTLRQISLLMKKDNLINACARSILSSLIFASEAALSADTKDKRSRRSEALLCETLQWLDNRRAENHIIAKRITLNSLSEWHHDSKGFFSHKENRFFRIVGLDVKSRLREVKEWGQPIIENTSSGIIGLLVKKSEKGLKLLLQAKAEPGNRTTVQVGPTVQFTQANYEGSRKLSKPFLFQEFLNPSSFTVLHESRQSEEGARFYREEHIHRILLLPECVDILPPADYHWVSIEEAAFLVHLGEQVNSCARSILSTLI